MAMSNRNAEVPVGLPEEIIVEILTRVPAKSVGQFRCVSKQWCSLLTHPKFIKAHLKIHAHKAERKLIFFSGFRSLYSITFNPQNGNDGIPRNLIFQQLPDNWYGIVGSCNGLVLVVDKQDNKFLINPTTLKYHQIPNFELSPHIPDLQDLYGLGYDSVTDDYKVVTLSHPNRPGVKSTSVDVYSVKKGLWRRLESSSCDKANTFVPCGVLVNGALHWYASKANIYRSVIFAFDLSGETFLELGMPKRSAYEEVHFFYGLVALRGCLCLVTNSEEIKLDVWMMKDYGVVESWTKFSVAIPSSVPILPLPICLTSDDDVVLDMIYEEKLIVYNMKEDEWWDLMVDGITPMYTSAGFFKESLVSPTFDEGSEGYFIA